MRFVFWADENVEFQRACRRRHGNIILWDEASFLGKLEKNVGVMLGDFRAEWLYPCHPPNGFQPGKPLRCPTGIGRHSNTDKQLRPDNSRKSVSFV